jgi:hypothetical protein
VKIMRNMCTVSIANANANAAASALISTSISTSTSESAIGNTSPLINRCISSGSNILPSRSTSSKTAPFLIVPVSPRSGSSLFNYSVSPPPQLEPYLLDTPPRRQRSSSVTSLAIEGRPAVRRNSVTSSTSAKLSILIANKQYERNETDSVSCSHSETL